MNGWFNWYVDYFMLLPKTLAERGKYPVLRVFGVLLVIPYLPVTVLGVVGLIVIALGEILRSAWNGELG